jgi:hypothetical protein
VDEKEFKATYSEVNEQPCVFAKAILTRCCRCERAQRLYIAEREAVACKSPGAHQQCAEILQAFRRKALFALRLTHLDEKLPHGKEIKVQCGGVLGLRNALNPDNEEQPDIHTTLARGMHVYGEIDAFPYTEIVKQITTYQARKGRQAAK